MAKEKYSYEEIKNLLDNIVKSNGVKLKHGYISQQEYMMSKSFTWDVLMGLDYIKDNKSIVIGDRVKVKSVTDNYLSEKEKNSVIGKTGRVIDILSDPYSHPYQVEYDDYQSAICLYKEEDLELI